MRCSCFCPVPYKERAGWQSVCKWLYVVINGVGVALNMADAVYFQYTGRRTTWTVFGEFSHEGNILSILGKEVLHHPFVLLIGVALIALLWLAYVHPRSLTKTPQPGSTLLCGANPRTGSLHSPCVWPVCAADSPRPCVPSR